MAIWFNDMIIALGILYCFEGSAHCPDAIWVRSPLILRIYRLVHSFLGLVFLGDLPTFSG